MIYNIEYEREEDGRWIAEAPQLPGVLAYGQTREEAMTKAAALALRVLAERLESDECSPTPISIAFSAAWASGLLLKPRNYLQPLCLSAGAWSASQVHTAHYIAQDLLILYLHFTMGKKSALECLPELQNILASNQAICEPTLSISSLSDSGESGCESSSFSISHRNSFLETETILM
jgi:predicted RNase H-like HicB family nuclease